MVQRLLAARRAGEGMPTSGLGHPRRRLLSAEVPQANERWLHGNSPTAEQGPAFLTSPWSLHLVTGFKVT